MPHVEEEDLDLKWINYLCLQLKQRDENGGIQEEEQGVFDQAKRMQRDYDSMWESSKEAVRKGGIEGFGKKTEEVTRGGIGLYHYLNPEAQEEIERKLIQPLKQRLRRFCEEHSPPLELDDLVYFYPKENLHFTVITFDYMEDNTHELLKRQNDYSLVSKCCLDQLLASSPSSSSSAPLSLKIHWRGVTSSRQAIILQGYPTSTFFNDYRALLRSATIEAGLPFNEGRHQVFITHSTLLRYRSSTSPSSSSLSSSSTFSSSPSSASVPHLFWEEVAKTIEELRRLPLTVTHFEDLSLMKVHYFFLPQFTKELERFPLHL